MAENEDVTLPQLSDIGDGAEAKRGEHIEPHLDLPHQEEETPGSGETDKEPGLFGGETFIEAEEEQGEAIIGEAETGEGFGNGETEEEETGERESDTKESEWEILVEQSEDVIEIVEDESREDETREPDVGGTDTALETDETTASQASEPATPKKMQKEGHAGNKMDEETTKKEAMQQLSSSGASHDSQGRPYSPKDIRPSSASQLEGEKEGKGHLIPPAPHFPFPGHSLSGAGMEGTMSNSALNIVWSFGVNRSVPALNLSDGVRKVVMYACAQAGIMYDFENHQQWILQGHLSAISCCCVSGDKRWLVTGEKGPDAMVNVWDTYTGVPIQTLFDPNPEGGAVAVALTPDARYLATLSAGHVQVLAIWDWTIDGERPICSADLQPSYGVQNYIYFNPEDIHHVVTNSETQVLFFKWEDRMIEYFAPPLTDNDFNKPVGRYSQSIYQSNSSRALTGTSIGNLVMWDNNKPLTKVVTTEQSADKKPLKIIKVQDRGINVLTTTDKYIVLGDQGGHVKFFDQSLKLIFWYQDMHTGPITSVSFASDPSFLALAREGTDYPNDTTIPAPKFVIQDYVVSSSTAIISNVTTNGTKVQIIQREHDGPVNALAPHPRLPFLAIGSYSGLLKIWNYETKQVIVSRVFEKGSSPQCCAFDPNGQYLVVGFTNGSVRVLDSLTLTDEMAAPFHFARDAILQIVFSHDSRFFATADAEYTTSIYRAEDADAAEPFLYLGRYRAHYKPIKDMLFGTHLDSNKPRLLSLGADRIMVEYDLEETTKDNIVLASRDLIEQSALPYCMMLYPTMTKESFILTANDQFKLKLFNVTTKMCRQTLLGPTYGSPVKKLLMVPTKGSNPTARHRYCAYINDDKVGLIIIPVDGNPHNSMALIAHPSGVGNMVVSNDGCYLFTAGGADATVHMWEININALEAQSLLGGKELVPFYGLLEGGREGELFAELEDYFYYGQIRSQGVNATDERKVSTTIPLAEIPFVMRALGFYPTEQEIEDMLNEVKFSRYVQTGQYVEELDLGSLIKLYANHRPAFGLSPEKLQWAFDVLGFPSPAGGVIDRGELLDMLQNKGEHMTEYELAEYVTTLLGFNPEGGSSELHELDITTAGDVIDQHMPSSITAVIFARDLLGFDLFADAPQAAVQ